MTYNRKALLAECLAALAGQTRPPDHVLVVDNASTDGTRDFVRAAHPEAELLALSENQGGAGGFHEGLKRAHCAGATWAWLMDDDTIPREDALEELLAAPEALGGRPPPMLLSSCVVWSDGRLHPMNEPAFKREPESFVESCERGVLPLRTATFVSLLVHRSAVDVFGLPLKHYFIWSDDIEYTARVVRDRPLGYLVPRSVVEHRTKTFYTAVTASGGRFYFHVRNSLYMLRSTAWTPHEKASLLWALAFTTYGYLRHNSFRRDNVLVVLRGVRDGLRPRAASYGEARRPAATARTAIGAREGWRRTSRSTSSPSS